MTESLLEARAVALITYLRSKADLNRRLLASGQVPSLRPDSPLLTDLPGALRELAGVLETINRHNRARTRTR